MYWKWIWKGLTFLLILSIIILGGFTIYKAGYIDGVAEGMIRSIPSEQGIKPYLASYHVTLLLLPLIGLILLFIFPLILFAGFRHFAWHRMGNSVHPSNLEEFKKRWKTKHSRHPYSEHWWDDSNQNQEKSTTPEEPNDQQANIDEKG